MTLGPLHRYVCTSIFSTSTIAPVTSRVAVPELADRDGSWADSGRPIAGTSGINWRSRWATNCLRDSRGLR
jgi:hypothetical protein